MIITKRHLPRRTFLRGLGAAVALPLLDGMVPALTAVRLTAARPVRRLGIVSADRVANVFLLRRDGTIAWHTSGLKYKAAFSHVFSVYLAMKVQIEGGSTHNLFTC